MAKQRLRSDSSDSKVHILLTHFAWLPHETDGFEMNLEVWKELVR